MTLSPETLKELKNQADKLIKLWLGWFHTEDTEVIAALHAAATVAVEYSDAEWHKKYQLLSEECSNAKAELAALRTPVGPVMVEERLNKEIDRVCHAYVMRDDTPFIENIRKVSQQVVVEAVAAERERWESGFEATKQQHRFNIKKNLEEAVMATYEKAVRVARYHDISNCLGMGAVRESIALELTRISESATKGQSYCETCYGIKGACRCPVEGVAEVANPPSLMALRREWSDIVVQAEGWFGFSVGISK